MVCRPWSNRTRCRTSSQAPCIGNRGLHITPGPSTWLRRKRSGLPGYPPWQLSLRYTCMENRKPSSLGQQQYSFEVANAMPLGNLRFGICNRLWHQWNIRIGTTAIELRYADLDRDVFQVSNESTIIELLEEYRHEWCNQQFFLTSGPLLPGISAFFVTTLLPQSASRGDFTIECTASHFSSTVKHPTTRNDPRNGLWLSQESQFIYLFI